MKATLTLEMAGRRWEIPVQVLEMPIDINESGLRCSTIRLVTDGAPRKLPKPTRRRASPRTRPKS